jgi:hypothetical protein
MSRTAPLMTLAAVGVLGGALFAVDTMRAHNPATAAANTAQSAAAPAAPQAAPPAGREVDLAGVPVAGAKDEAAAPADAPAGDAPTGGDDAAGKAGEEAGAAETSSDLFAGESDDGSLTVSIGVNGNKAAAAVGDGRKPDVALSGSATARGLDLADRTGKVTLDGSVADNSFSGTITVNGKSFDYTADGTTVAKAAATGRDDVAGVAKKVGL